jgi:uncharacterized protein YfaT (DUF1175 family)
MTMPNYPKSISLRNDQLSPDGVRIKINWEQFVVGSSIFVPAINLVKLNKQMQDVARFKEIQVKGFDRIENGKLGMRFWRVL